MDIFTKGLTHGFFPKNRKIDIFPEGLIHGSDQKMAIFSTSFLGNIGKENVFYDILERKNSFLAFKNKKLKKSKNWHFYKRVNSWFFSKKSKNWHFSRRVNPWFWSKNGHFFNFFFRQYRQGKCLLRYFRTKKLLSSL